MFSGRRNKQVTYVEKPQTSQIEIHTWFDEIHSIVNRALSSLHEWLLEISPSSFIKLSLESELPSMFYS